MEQLFGSIQIKVNQNIFVKDPQSSDLGKRIVEGSIYQIDDLGFEGFTFRKLASHLGTTESSIYRYFESKHKLLVYLISIYWGWMEYLMVFKTVNRGSAEDRLKLVIDLLVNVKHQDVNQVDFDWSALSRIIISESSKAYLTKEVDESNKLGFYQAYKRFVGRASELVLELAPDYPYPHTLMSTIIEGIHHQQYFALHLPSLSDVTTDESQLTKFYSDLAIRTINSSQNG